MEACFRWSKSQLASSLLTSKKPLKVSHQILPQKLQASGLCGDSFDWIVNYINNRYQFVSINGTNSEKMRLTSGVPQGSLLGPRRFSIFTNDLPLSLDSKLEMFADDSTAFIIGNSIDSISTQIQDLLHQLITWSKFNSMFIHPVKSEVMLISKTPFIGPIRLITIDDKPTNCVSSSSCLGVKLDNEPQLVSSHQNGYFKLQRKDFQA